MKKFLPVLFILFFHNAFSQWYRTFNCPPENEAGVNSVVCDRLGNIFVSGFCWTGVVTELNFLLIKYNQSGDTLWTRSYDGPTAGEDIIIASVTDNQNNIIVTGKSESTTGYDIFTIKYNPSGAPQWSQRYNGSANGYDEPFAISSDDSLNVYVTGSSASTGNYTSIVTIKYNSSGVQQWVRKYNGDSVGINKPFSLVVNKSSGNIFISGYISTLSGGSDIITLKYNRFGNLLWSKRFNGIANLNDEGKCIGIDASENVYVSGVTALDSINTDFVTIKYSASGNQIWTKYYSGSAGREDSPSSILVDSSGNSYVTGYSFLGSGGVVNEFVTIKYDSSGTQKWLSQYSPAGSSIPVSISLNSQSDVIVCGKSQSSIPSFNDYVAVKYNSQTGIQSGNFRFHIPGTKNNELVSSAMDNQDNIYLSGNAVTDTSVVIGTVKVLNNSIGIKNISNNIPQKFKLFQNYPNPFNPETKIRFEFPLSKGGLKGVVSLKIFDILGKEITTLINEQLHPGTYEVTFDASQYSSGIYFYKLTTDSFIETKKMIIVK